MPYRDFEGVLVWGETEPKVLEQMRNCVRVGQEAEDVAYRGALMADNHLGYSMPIGGVVAYRDWVSPSGVGYDIACGNKAARTDITWGELEPDLERVLEIIQREISFGMGRNNDDPEAAEHPMFDKGSHPAWDIAYIGKLKRKAQNQLGTVGSGNHYVDLLVECREVDDEYLGQGLYTAKDARVWIGVHFGSRGLGHSIASGYLKLAKGQRWDDKARGEQMMDAPTLLKVGSGLGDEYLAAMDLAGTYAYAGRDYVVDKVARILGAKTDFEVHNHHNYAWEEQIDGEKLWVVRKGATPAYPDQWGFIGGSMGDISAIVQGVESVEAQAALHSTVHGAGRVMSRTQAAGKMNYKTRQRAGGLITPAQMQDAVAQFGVKLRGGGTDESPMVYRRLGSVLEAHREALAVRTLLKPVGVVMAGEDVVDIYKD